MSGKHSGEEFDLSVMMTGIGDGGVPHGELLMAFAEAVVTHQEEAIVTTRSALVDAIGEDGLIDAAGVVGLFNAIDRVADATGTELEHDKAEATDAMRRSIGITGFAEAKATLDQT